jgi:hypothetical protein
MLNPQLLGLSFNEASAVRRHEPILPPYTTERFATPFTAANIVPGDKAAHTRNHLIRLIRRQLLSGMGSAIAQTSPLGNPILTRRGAFHRNPFEIGLKHRAGKKHGGIQEIVLNKSLRFVQKTKMYSPIGE